MALSRLGAVALVAGIVVRAASPRPISLDPSEWLGIDGNWSTVKTQLGQPPQAVHLLISTAISEIWAVSSGGCIEGQNRCYEERGGVFDIDDSSSWQELGTFGSELFMANLDFGKEDVVSYDPYEDIMFSMSDVLVGAVNSSRIFLGFYGLGIVATNFEGVGTGYSPIQLAVLENEWLPSYSYGYTAGAHYKNTPVSMTLGGYDRSRLDYHEKEFMLTNNATEPWVLMRGIEVKPTSGNPVPQAWESSTEILSSMNTSFQVLIDSTTPFLWLPDQVCDMFAEALDLTYNETFDLYVLDQDQRRTFNDASFEFTFSMSSIDNIDELDDPLGVDGVVNITISSAAFSGLLEFPFMDAFRFGVDPAVPYFPLRRLGNSSNAVLGRSFLQESFLLTQYDRGVFSVHQALFPDDPSRSADIVQIDAPPDTVLPYPERSEGQSGLSVTQMAGIAAGVAVLCIVGLVFWCCTRRRKRSKRMPLPEDNKDTASSIVPETPRTPVGRILSKIGRRKRSKRKEPEKAIGSETNPVEVANHEVYELPAPLEPVELCADNANDDASLHGETEMGTEASSQGVSAYEAARRKMERQLQGPLPTYAPPSEPSTEPSTGTGGDKSVQDVSPVVTYRPSDGSPTSSPTTANTNSLPGALPSPMSPHPDWPGRAMADHLPSPITVAPPFPSPIFTSFNNTSSLPPQNTSPSSNVSPQSMSRSNSDNATSPHSPAASVVPPSPSYQRTPIDQTSRVICLGPLPENIQVPGPAAPSNAAPPSGAVPRLVGPDGRSVQLAGMTNPDARVSTETLGSNYTDMEEQHLEELTRQASMTTHSPGRGSARSPVSPLQTGGSRGQRSFERRPDDVETAQSPRSVRSHERIDAGSELIHVPQMAEKRYSWEEER